MTENNTQGTKIETEVFICPNCGGELRHDAKKDKFLCTSCRYEGALHGENDRVEEQNFDDYEEREAQSVPFAGMAVASCKNCGSQITYEETTISTVCPMCGSAQIAQSKQKAGIPPEGIIPFKIDKKEAEAKFHSWVKGLWFSPNKLKKSYQGGNLVGRFVPFWTYDADGAASYTGRGGKNRKVKDKEGKETTVTDWFPVSGFVHEHFDDVLVVAATGDSAQDARQVGTFDTISELRPYATEYLAGYQAELYTIKADEGFEIAKSEMKGLLMSGATADILAKYDTSDRVEIFPQYSNVTYKHVLLPIWSSIFAYGGKTYRYVVNGASGNVYGQRPYSVPKIVAAIAVVVAIIMGGFALFQEDEKQVAVGTMETQYVMMEADTQAVEPMVL